MRQCRPLKTRALTVGRARLAVENIRLLNHMGQLANVAGPWIFAEPRQDFGRGTPDFAVVRSGVHFREERDELGNVFHALAQRRDDEFDHAKTVIQVLAEATLGNFFFKMAIRGGDHLYVDLYWLRRADGGHFVFL